MAAPNTLVDTTFSGKNISSAVSVYEYTVLADAWISFQVRLAAVAGNGDYIAYLTLNDGDALTDDAIGPRTTYAAASGETAFWMVSLPIAFKAGDVINVMVTGQAGDTDEAGSIRIFSDAALMPTVAGRTLDVEAGGTTGIDLANINAASAPTTLTNITIPTVTTLTNAPSDSSGVTTLLTRLSAARAGYLDYLAGWSTTIFAQIAGIIDTLLATNHGSGAWGAGGNGGSLSLTYTLTRSDTGAAIDGATVELYSDASMTALVSSGTTNSLGVVTFTSLLAGTYYLKRLKNGFSFQNPDSEVVAA